MQINCNILVIGDEDECRLIHEAIPGKLEHLRLHGEPLQLDLLVEELVLHRSWEVDFSNRAWDICIFSVTSTDAHLFIGNARMLQDRVRGILYITESGEDLPNDVELRLARDSRLNRPFSPHSLAMYIERMAYRLYRRHYNDVTEEEVLALTKSFLDQTNGLKPIVPHFDERFDEGFHYPAVGKHCGLNANDIDVLDNMLALGLLEKELDDRLRCCSNCGSHHLNFREKCPRCDSIDFVEETIIHHFPCGHVDSISKFRNEGQLICPKCNLLLKQIGMDYEKPAANAKCLSCEYIFADAEIEANCLNCGLSSEPADTKTKDVFRYRTLPYAEEAVAVNSISTVDLNTLLRHKQSGLHSRQLYLFELEREVVRFKRYGLPSSIIMVRVNELGRLREHLGEETSDFIQTLFQSISGLLRDLDITCIWDRSILAVLLPGTPLEGAWTVGRHMEERAQSNELPFQMENNYLTTSCETIRQDIDNGETMIQNALSLFESLDLLEADGDPFSQ